MAKKRSQKRPEDAAEKPVRESGLPTKINEKELEYLKDYAAVPKHYANNTLVTTSLYDVKFVFGQIINQDGNKLMVDPEVMFFMSPQHAKVLVGMIERQLKVYEERNGPIPVNPDKP